MKLQKLVSALLHIVSIQQQGTSLQIQQLLPEGLRNIFLVVKGQLSHKANSNRCSAPSLPVTPSIRPGSPPHFLPFAPVVLWHDKPASGGPCLGSQGHYPRSPILHFCSYPLPCPRALHFTTLLGEASFSPSWRQLVTPVLRTSFVHGCCPRTFSVAPIGISQGPSAGVPIMSMTAWEMSGHIFAKFWVQLPMCSLTASIILFSNSTSFWKRLQNLL